MKKNVLLSFTAILFLFGCVNETVQWEGNALRQFTEEPVSITWTGSKDMGVQSYQANVHVFSKNNRKDTLAVMDRSYRMTVKTVNDRILTRLDFDFGDEILFRSFVSDGEELIVFNPATEEIGYKIPLEDSKSPLYRIFGNQSGVSRINLSLIREEANRLSLNMREANDGDIKTLLLELPPGMVPQNGLDRITSSRALFNITDETLIETEVMMIREDETIVTTTVTPVYEDIDGVPVKIGQITVIDSRTPSLIEGFDPNVPVYNSPDDIPTLTQSELEELRGTGGIYEIPDIEFGNPADLSFVETIFEVYQDIEINAAPDNLFRLILEEGGQK